jgi:hypothetical protein
VQLNELLPKNLTLLIVKVEKSSKILMETFEAWEDEPPFKFFEIQI